MTKDEFARFTMALKTYYPRETILPNEQAMELWFMHLQDIPFEVASTALNAWVDTQKWSPGISDIRKMCETVVHGEQETWSEGWEQLQAAIRRYGFYDPDGAMEFLTGTTRETVRRLGFQNLCLSENEMSDRAQFRAVFESITDREVNHAQIAPSVYEKMQMLQTKALKRLGDGT